MKKFIKFLLCFNSLSANTIEILIIILSFIGAIITIVGLAIIPWKYTSKIMEIFYILSLIFFIISIIKSFFFLYNRKYHKLQDNSKKLKISILLCFFELFECIFSIFIHLFIAAGAIPDLKDNKSTQNTKTTEIDGELIITEDEETNLITNGELGFAIFSIIFNLLIWITLLLLSISDFIRIKLGIEGSYNNYLKDEENIKKDLNTERNDKSQEIKYSNANMVKMDTYNTNTNNNKNISHIPVYRKAKSDYNFKFDFNTSSFTRNETEANNVYRYSYKEKCINKNCNSVDIIQKSKMSNSYKEKCLEKYLEGYGADPYYSNFDNKSALNVSSMNNSMNPVY